MGEEKGIIKNSKDSFGKFSKYFESPMALLQRAYDYIEWCENNPLYKTEQLNKVGKGTVMEDGTYIPPETMVEMPLVRAPTLQGFAVQFCGVSSQYFYDLRMHIKEGRVKDIDGNWLNVLDMIRDLIFDKQYANAAAGKLDGRIVSRYLGLADKVETKTEVKTTKEVIVIGGKEFEM